MTERFGFLAVLLAASSLACGGGESGSAVGAPGEPSRPGSEGERAPASSEPGAPTPSGGWIRIAPSECPPAPASGEAHPWTAPDTVPLGAGATLELQGCESQGEGWAVPSYEGAAPTEPYHVVSVQHYEGSSWIVLNAESGRWQSVRGRPRFSPGGRWVATGALDLEAGYIPNHLDVYEAGPDSIRRVMALDGDDTWGAAELRWASEERVEYLRVRRSDDADRFPAYDTTASGASFEDGRWVPDSLPPAP